tara:strand:+ start:1194 stop:1724 length:531 start_codon:yes stop_codon:yes gene_type:complete
MKFKNLYYYIIIIYLISFSFAYSIDRPDIKNITIHKDKKKIENIEFINSKNQKVNLKYFNTNVLIVNFWATWCSPCKKEMLSLDNLKLNQQLKNIKIIPINVGGDTVKKSQKFFDDLDIKNLEFFIDNTGNIPKKFNIRGIPTTILIDKNGYEFARILGYIDFENKSFLDWLINYS